MDRAGIGGIEASPVASDHNADVTAQARCSLDSQALPEAGGGSAQWAVKIPRGRAVGGEEQRRVEGAIQARLADDEL
jgi:hypothetical protein